MRYAAAPAVREELEALVAAERQCCGFVDWQVVPAARFVVRRITASADSSGDVPTLAGLFGAV